MAKNQRNQKGKEQSKDQDVTTKAHEEAEKDILSDPDLEEGDATDDLDEGELAQKDNSDEDAFDALEHPHSGKNKDKEK